MADTLETAIAVLKEKLPEFNIGILGAHTLSPGLLDLVVGEKIVVALPQEHAGLRFTLLRELANRTGIYFHSDSRSLDGACVNIEDLNAHIRKLCSEAVQEKLAAMTIQYLDVNTSSADRDSALKTRRADSGFADALLAIGESKLRPR